MTTVATPLLSDHLEKYKVSRPRCLDILPLTLTAYLESRSILPQFPGARIEKLEKRCSFVRHLLECRTDAV